MTSCCHLSHFKFIYSSFYGCILANQHSVLCYCITTHQTAGINKWWNRILIFHHQDNSRNFMTTGWPHPHFSLAGGEGQEHSSALCLFKPEMKTEMWKITNRTLGWGVTKGWNCLRAVLLSEWPPGLGLPSSHFGVNIPEIVFSVYLGFSFHLFFSPHISIFLLSLENVDISGLVCWACFPLPLWIAFLPILYVFW